MELANNFLDSFFYGCENELLAMDRPFSNSRADLAGKIIARRATSPSVDHPRAFLMVAQWRTFHAHALRETGNRLKERAIQIDPTVTLSQRLKRLESIRRKLMRSKTCALTQMQDIGGCRAVVETIGHVFQLKQLYEQHAKVNSSVGPELLVPSTRDYLLKPKDDGYRSLHFVLRYRTTVKSRLHCNGLRIEVQIRTRLQHAWAMAVETVDALTKQDLKFGGGKQDWKEFFPSNFQRDSHQRGLAASAGDRGRRATRQNRRIIEPDKGSSVIRGRWKRCHQCPARERSRRRLLLVDAGCGSRMTDYKAFGIREFKDAVDEYARLELEHRTNPHVQVVLVAVDSINMLHKAYPSYFLDVQQFIQLIRECCASAKQQ